MRGCLRGKTVAGLLCLCLALGMVTAGCGQKAKEEVSPKMAVAVAEVKRGTVQREVSLSGMVKGENEVSVYPKVAARVVAVEVAEGDRVAAGQVLMRLDPTDYQAAVEAAQAGVMQAEANWENRRKDWERTLMLHQQGVASDQQLEGARLLYVQAEAALTQAKASLFNAKNALENCKITSPLTGVVGLVAVGQGSMVSPQVAVAVITTPRDLKVDVGVSDRDVNYVKKGQKVLVKVGSLNGKVLPGEVVSVSQVVDPRTRQYPVKIALQDGQGLLKSGMFAEVTLATERKENVIVVPKTALGEKGARRVVFVVDDKGVAHEREVKVGLAGREEVEILQGLKEGELVVIRGQTLIRDGDEVRVVSGKEGRS